MNKVMILTDSCADLPKDLREKYNIDYVKMNTVYQDKETPASLDWETISPRDFYDISRRGERVKTTQVPADRFETAFRHYLDLGYDIVYIACSVKQSGSVNTATVVANKLLESYKDQKIFSVDSYNSSLGEGLVAIKAAEFRDQGLSSEEIANKIVEIRKNVNEFITVNSLDALKRAGRVKGSAAFFGNLFGVKPILIADANGVQTPILKVKGRKQSMAKVVELLKEAIVEPENQTIYVVHADCPEEAEELKNLVKEAIPCKDVYIAYIGPIVGASIGPGAIGVFGFGKKVTYSVEEKK